MSEFEVRTSTSVAGDIWNVWSGVDHVTVSASGLTVASTHFMGSVPLVSAAHARAIATALTDWADRQETNDA